MAVVRSQIHREAERHDAHLTSLRAPEARGRAILAVVTSLLAIVGAWSLCVAVAAAGFAALGVGSYDLALGALGVGVTASVAIVVAEMVANHPSRHRRL